MVVGIVSDEVERYPDYTIICAGHSLGGSLASLAAVSLRHNIPQVEDVKLFTFGQPRTGTSNMHNLWNNLSVLLTHSALSICMMVCRP